MHEPPRSIESRNIAPWLMFGAGTITIAQFIILSHNLGLAVLGLGIPTVGTTAAAWFLARRRALAALVAVLAWFALHALTALVAGVTVPNAMVASGVTLVLALPAFGLIAALARRRELYVGDRLLGTGALWFAGLQMIYVGTTYVGLTDWELTYPAIAFGFFAATLTLVLLVARGLQRRRWFARAARGELDGWSVREPADGEIAKLPLAFTHRKRAVMMVLERRDVSLAVTPYRSDILCTPLAIFPVPRAALQRGAIEIPPGTSSTVTP